MSRKILVVEDEEVIRRVIAAIFNFQDEYQVFFSQDGEEGIRKAREVNPDVILLDARLPKINGYEVCKSVKSEPALAHARVLMMSGLVQYYDRQKAREAGVDDYIAKPFSATDLVEKVEKLL